MSDQQPQTILAAPSFSGELVGRLKSKLKAAMTALKTKEDEAADLVKRLEKSEKKFDESALKRENESMRQELRTMAHRKAFDRVAKTKGATDEVLDDLFVLSGYKAEADQVDETAIGTLLDAQKAMPGRSRLFGGTNGEAPIINPLKPGPASGQGVSSGEKSPYELGEADPRLSDVKYQMQNFDRISQAATDRINRGEI